MIITTDMLQEKYSSYVNALDKFKTINKTNKKAIRH